LVEETDVLEGDDEGGSVGGGREGDDGGFVVGADLAQRPQARAEMEGRSSIASRMNELITPARKRKYIARRLCGLSLAMFG
jgi:hypothetical protein